MTKYTAEDFKYADFAMHPLTGSVASKGRMDWKWVLPGWYDTGDVRRLSDQQMADAGWSIVRNAKSLTAREHLDAAWDKAHETDAIPAGAGYVTKWDNGDVVASLEGEQVELPSRNPILERRLLDKPVPAWHRAQIIRARRDDQDSARWARMDSGRWVCLDGESAGIECEPVDLSDVTVIVGAEQ